MRNTDSGANTWDDHVVELRGRRQVVAERLLDDDPPPRAVRRCSARPGPGQLPSDQREGLGRHRQVEGVVAAGALLRVELGDGGLSRSKASSSSNSPWTKRMPSASCRQVSSRNGVRACSCTASCTTWAKSWSSQSRRANPVRANPGGSRPRLARSYTAGMSFLRARSPVTPKITRPHGPAMRGSRRSRGSRSGLRSAVTGSAHPVRLQGRRDRAEQVLVPAVA